MDSTQQASPFNPAVGPPPLRILVVEDDLVTQTMLVDKLKEIGYAVDGAASAESATELIAATTYDVAFVDMVLPGETGLGFLTTLRARCSRTEVIVMTASPAVRDAIACLQAGAVNYVLKPIVVEGLAPLVQQALDRQRAAARLATLEACQSIFCEQDAAKVPEVIVNAAMKALGADDASLMLDDGAGHLRLSYSHSLRGTPHDGARQALGERIAGRVALGRGPVVVADGLVGDPRFKDLSPSSRQIFASMVCPLAVGERLLGVLNINRLSIRCAFKQADVEEAAVVAAQAALAIDHARLVRELNLRVTDLSRAQSCMVQSERLAAIGQLAAGVAHEINNPVAYVMANVDFVLAAFDGFGELAGDANDAATAEWLLRAWQAGGGAPAFTELKQALTEAKEGAGRIREIVADMRTLARADSVAHEIFDLNRAVRSAVRLASAEIRGVAELKLELGDDIMVRGSVGRLSQVFLNLLVNASQAIPSGQGATAKISVKTCREGDTVVASVADTGCGIPLDVQAHVFEPFFTTKPVGRGTGLGLSISREAVRRHDGDLTFWSQPGVGSTFTLTLPAADSPVACGSRQPPRSRGDAAAARRARLLFVEDEDSLCRSYQRYFGGRHEVVIACDGRQALEVMARQRDFDLIVCDLVMPGMSGMELFRLVADKFPHLEPRFVFVTGGVGRAEVQNFLVEVRSPVFEKPFKFEQLDSLIAETLTACIG